MSKNAGGFVFLTIDGVGHSPAGEVEIEETNFEAEAVVNQDGSVQRTVKPKPYKIKLTLRDKRGVNESIMRAVYNAESLDVSAYEREMGRRVIMTGSFATGTPSRNTATGEISGIEIAGGEQSIQAA